MKNKVVVIGFGNVGINYVYSLINQQLNIAEIAIIDTNLDKTIGEIMDIQHGQSFCNSKINIYLGKYDDCKNADLVVISAGAKQKQGQNRMDLLNENATIIKNIVEKVLATGFNGIFLNATNPLDVMTYLIYKYSKFSPSKVIGSGTALDTSRLKCILKDKYKCEYKDINAFVLGEHGDSQVVCWSNVIINNNKVSNSISQIEKDSIESSVKNMGYKLLNLKGYSSQAIGMCLSYITKAIINNEGKLIPLSVYDEKNNVYYGSLAIVDKNGVKFKPTIYLSKQEQVKLDNSISKIKEAINTIKIS